MIFADRTRFNNRLSWHYINWPFNPQGQPLGVQRRDPEPVNILTAMAENESVVKQESDVERKAIALAWLFHLVGDIQQPLHTAQLFTLDYPQGDRGGNQNLHPGNASGAAHEPAQVLRRGNCVKCKSDPATKRGHSATQSPGVSAQSAHQSCVH
jgi:hypothetical protein